MQSSMQVPNNLDLDSLDKSISQLAQFVTREQSHLSEGKEANGPVSSFINDLIALRQAVATSNNSSSHEECKKINLFITKFNAAISKTISKEENKEEQLKAVSEALAAAEEIQSAETENLPNIAYRVMGGLIGLILGIPLRTVGAVVAVIALCKDSNSMFLTPDPFTLKLFFIGAMVIGALSGEGYGAFLGWTKLSKQLHDFVQSLVSDEDPKNSAVPAQIEHPIKKAANSVLKSSFFSKQPKPLAPPALSQPHPPGGPSPFTA